MSRSTEPTCHLPKHRIGQTRVFNSLTDPSHPLTRIRVCQLIVGSIYEWSPLPQLVGRRRRFSTVNYYVSSHQSRRAFTRDGVGSRRLGSATGGGWAEATPRDCLADRGARGGSLATCCLCRKGVHARARVRGHPHGLQGCCLSSPHRPIAVRGHQVTAGRAAPADLPASSVSLASDHSAGDAADPVACRMLYRCDLPSPYNRASPRPR